MTLTEDQAAGLIELYQGEVLGEALFDALLPMAETDDQRMKLAMMVQLETETKARLRPILLKAGIDIAESAVMRAQGQAMAASLRDMSWRQKMGAVHAQLSGSFVPRYHEIACLFDGTNDAAWSMIAHEEALTEFVRLEADGKTDQSAAVIKPHLNWPI